MTTEADIDDLLKRDFFAVLGVPRSALTDDIKKGYLTTVKVFHPDRAPTEALRPAFTKAFARIELAKATLMDPTRRAKYLDELVGRANGGSDRSAAEASFEFAKADAYLKTNDRTRAEQHIRRAVTLAPNNVEYAVLLVAVRASAEATPDTLKELAADLDQLILKSPESERGLFHRGQIRKRLGRTSDAMKDFARVAELNPSNIDAAREVRLHKMRAQEQLAPERESERNQGGLGGFFRGLFKK